MTEEFENALKRQFAAPDEELPAAHFTSVVMTEVLRPRRRRRLLWSSAFLAVGAFLWFSFPDLKAACVLVAGSARSVVNVAFASLVAVSHSPLLYIYGAALGGYLLLWLMRRFQIRLM